MLMNIRTRVGSEAAFMTASYCFNPSCILCIDI